MYDGKCSAQRRACLKRKPRLIIILTMSIVISLSANAAKVLCPSECSCQDAYDSEAVYYLRIVCSKGNMHIIPVELFDRGAQVIIISAPKDRPNFLAIGPIFNQPSPFLNLRELHIINSNIPSIGQNSFWGLQHLRVINLTYNKLTSIGADNFKGLINLTDLNLDHNNIEQMPNETFRYLTALKTLILSHNQISTLVPRLFRMLAKLIHLDLSNNPLSVLTSDVFKDIQQLRVFKCRRCLLRRSNTHIYHLMAHLEELDLGENQFKYLATDVFISLKKLKKLNLDGNQLSIIVDKMFGRNRELRILSLGHNRLAMLEPDAFINLTSLIHLDISHNKINHFHLKTFSPVVVSLKTINFSGNNLPLNEIVIVLQILPDIHNVGLASLSLEELPPNFFMYNVHLVGLDLSWNKLTKFPLKQLAKTKFLQSLDLSRNCIESLEEEDLRRLEAIAHVDLSRNIWRCDQCSVSKMLAYMNTTVLNDSIRHLTCYSPLRVRGMKFSEVTFNVLDTCSISYEARICILAGLFLLSIAIYLAITSALCCIRRRAAHHYTNEDNRRELEQDHPEEILNRTEVDTVAAIHAPYNLVSKSSEQYAHTSLRRQRPTLVTYVPAELSEFKQVDLGLQNATR